MAETFEKVNDYTLRAKNMLEEGNNWARSVTRLFNFKAQQVTTIASEWRVYGQAPAVSNQMTTQRFDEFQSQEEIKLMRDKLVELKGNPPELPEADLKKPRSPALGATNGQ